MPLAIERNDITRMRVDAIVNAANERLLHGGGVCGAIFAAAGARELQAACDRIGHCDTGQAVATPAFRLHAKHVIHTVGPIWHGGNHGEEELLASCYRTSLALASELGDTSIAFPLISSGIYGYPKDAAIDVALTEIQAYLREHEMDVHLIIFDAESLRATHGRYARVAEYINDQYVRQSPYARRERWEQSLNVPDSAYLDEAPAAKEAPAPAPQAAPCGAASRTPMSMASAEQPSRLKNLLHHLDASFSTTLLHMIDQRGLSDSEVYKRANMSRQHFSKIRSNKHYKPKKQTVLALAIALELSLEDTRLLLERAGYALTHADERDIIVEYFINQRNYDIFDINLALYAFDQPLLG